MRACVGEGRRGGIEIVDFLVLLVDGGGRRMGRPAREAWMWEWEGERCVPGPGV